MKSFSIKTMSAIVLLVMTVGLISAAQAADWTYPAIKYGPVHPLPNAGVQPDKSLTYKALFDVTSGSRKPDKPIGGLEHVARAVNVFASAGVPTRNLDFVIILHGPSTFAILSNAAYKKKFGVDNPNIPVIDALVKTGVHIDVCGQALAGLKIPHADVYSPVRIDLSALSTTVIYGDMGYAYMKL